MNITFCRRALLVVLAALAIIPATASAQMRDRAGRWEGTIQTRYSGSYTVDGQNGSKADLGSAFGLGFGFAYNFNNKMSAGVDFSWASQDNTYTAGGATSITDPPVVTKATAYSSTLQLNGTYNLIDGPITPYVTGFIGATYFDSGVADGISNGCYWYPYYGYVCGNYVYTKTSTYFTYGAGVGVRWDVNDSFFIKGGVQQQWYDVGGADGTPNMTIGRLDFGMKF